MTKKHNPFAGKIETLRQETARAEAGGTQTKPKAKYKATHSAKCRRERLRDNGAYAPMPLWWAQRASEDCGEYGPPHVLVCVELVHRAWEAEEKGGDLVAFVMPKVVGVTKRVKIRSLRALEAAGLIKVQWRTGRSPLVTSTERFRWVLPLRNGGRYL